MGTRMTRITCLACCQHTQQGILEVSIIKRMDILLQLVVHSGVNLKKKISVFSVSEAVAVATTSSQKCLQEDGEIENIASM